MVWVLNLALLEGNSGKHGEISLRVVVATQPACADNEGTDHRGGNPCPFSGGGWDDEEIAAGKGRGIYPHCAILEKISAF